MWLTQKPTQHCCSALQIHNWSWILILNLFPNVCFWIKDSQPWYDMYVLICMLARIYRVNNLPHHMGVSATREAYYHCECSPTRACLSFWSEVSACVGARILRLARTLAFLWCQRKSKHAEQERRHRKRSERDKTEEGLWQKRQRWVKDGEGRAECRSGPKGLLHEGGLGGTANYAWHYWISCSACYILLRGVRRRTP